MIVSHPTVSVTTMKRMYPELQTHAEELIDGGYWFYSIHQHQFLSYIPLLNLYVQGFPGVKHPIEKSKATFLLRPYSSVYEITLEDGNFPSSILLASNLQQLVTEHLDVNENTHILVLDNQMSPVMLGNKQALKRMVITETPDNFQLFKLTNLLQKESET